MNENKQATTAFVYDESYFWHETGTGALFLPAGGWVEPDSHVESPESKRRVKNLLERSGFMKRLHVVNPRPATREEIARVHTESYIAHVQQLSDTTGGDAGELAIVGRGSYEIALQSAGGALTGVDLVMRGEARNVYAITRPPGHHAEPDKGMGFCLFNNVAIAAKYAQEKYGLKRILIVDWDVHHGNGTETAFYDDPGVLFFSVHEETNFPLDRGYVEHIGIENGRGYTVNVPLPAGTTNAGYLHALERVLVPIADQYKPELVLVSAGQDANIFDPLARMMVTSNGFGQIAQLVKDIAERHCDGRLVLCHEGGYSTGYVPFCTVAIIEALRGEKSGVEDPFQITVDQERLKIVLPHHKAAVDQAVQIQSEFWDLSRN
jgi:acetoin utilization deacetylase AcuC-like enzyme